MLKKIDWESQIGRRLKMRDLHVFFTVAQRGSMGKAAVELGVSPPTISEVISDLEHGLGVKLLDRSPGASSRPCMGMRCSGAASPHSTS